MDPQRSQCKRPTFQHDNGLQEFMTSKRPMNFARSFLFMNIPMCSQFFLEQWNFQQTNCLETPTGTDWMGKLWIISISIVICNPVKTMANLRYETRSLVAQWRSPCCVSTSHALHFHPRSWHVKTHIFHMSFLHFPSFPIDFLS